MKAIPEPATPASTNTHPLRYDDESRRWCIGTHELHCGDCFDLFPDRNDLPPLPVRIEHCSTGWYLITPYGCTQLSTRRAKL